MNDLPVSPLVSNSELIDLESKFQREILDLGVSSNHTLPEEVFVDVFLPFFAGEEKVDSQNNTVAKWISVAGTPMAEVTIIDNNGDTLFSVPSIFDTSVIDVVKKDIRLGLKEIVANKEIHSRNIPAAGEKYIVNALDQKANAILRPSLVVEKNAARWNEILTRYGKAKISIESEESTHDIDSIDDFFS